MKKSPTYEKEQLKTVDEMDTILRKNRLRELGFNIPKGNQSSDILQHSQNRPTGDRWLKF